MDRGNEIDLSEIKKEKDKIGQKQRKEEEKHYKRYKSNNYSFKGQNHGIPIM